MWVLPGNSLVPNAKLGRHDSTFIVYRMNLFSLVKNRAYRFVLPFGQAADLIIRLKRIVNDQKKKSSNFILVFYLVAVVSVHRRLYI